jgi:UPF0716 protein FxsA
VLARLLLLFTVVPLLELSLLLPIAETIGTLQTVGLVVVTGFLGAVLGKKQGLGVLKRIQTELAAGGLPADPILDGLIILVACTLLVTPGVLTDLTGILLLMPPLRRPVRRLIHSKFTKLLRDGTVTVIDVAPGSGAGPSGVGRSEIIDVTPE